MYRTKTNPNNVVIWQHESTTPRLEKIAETEGLDQLPPVPVFELPEQYRELGDYVIHDGHNRREAARKANVDLSLLVLEQAIDFKEVEEYNSPLWYEINSEEFERWIKFKIDSALRYNTKSQTPSQ